jgi:hypothetical protein
MTDAVRRFLTRLDTEGRDHLLQHLGLAAPDVSGLKARERDKRLIDAVTTAGDVIRGHAEGISAHVLLLSDKGELAERALRAVCGRDRVDLLEILESDRSLEQRIFFLWLDDAKLLDRARNIALTHHWRDGRYHCSFTTTNPQPVNADLSNAVHDIQTIVQKAHGGRKVAVDVFTYIDQEASDQLIHHIAIYLETPASVLMEFKDSEHPIPVLRREAKEIAIDYNPRTGQLEIAGKGIGGSKVFQRLAESFGATALQGTELSEITREEWQLRQFLRGHPADLLPPPGYTVVRVTEMVLYSTQAAGGKLIVRAGQGQDVYARLHELGISKSKLCLETLYAVTFTLEAPPQVENEDGREVRVALTRPNSRSFDGASIRDRKAIEAWLKDAPFVLAK